MCFSSTFRRRLAGDTSVLSGDLTFDRLGGPVTFDINFDAALFDGKPVRYLLEISESVDAGVIVVSEVLIISSHRLVWRTGDSPDSPVLWLIGATRRYLPEAVWPNAILDPSRPARSSPGFIQNINNFVLVHLMVMDVKRFGCRIDIESRSQLVPNLFQRVSRQRIVERAARRSDFRRRPEVRSSKQKSSPVAQEDVAELWG
jgi:hypothetical protein